MAGKIYKNAFELNNAWGDGRRAAETGLLIGDNPFPVGVPENTAWIAGFSDVFNITPVPTDLQSSTI